MSHEAVDKCTSCGSDRISLDYENESWNCEDCGSAGGGANFWK